MKKIVISINSLLNNRGSEALIRGLVVTLQKACQDATDITVISSEPHIESKKRIDGVDRYICRYSTKQSSGRLSLWMRLLRKLHLSDQSKQKGEKSGFSHLKKYVQSADVFIVIGADNYCGYGLFEEMHRFNVWIKQHLKGQFWFYNCSIEKKFITEQIVEDLNLFDGITIRDSLSMKEIAGNGVFCPVYFMPDPAFLMDKVVYDSNALSSWLADSPYVVLNLSNLIVDKQWGGKLETITANYIETVKYIRDVLHLKVLLLPHVMGGADLQALRLLKSFFPDDEDIILFADETITAPQLKYLISHSRFVVTARTHASIAAYSEAVPTLVLGYSIKSKGIAKDLFGEYEHYVVPVDALTHGDTLRERFQWIVDHEEAIITRLKAVMPRYKNNAAQIGTLVFGEVWKKENDCCGCSACADVCPQGCILMKYSKEGFYYPAVDRSRCNNCGLCRNVCPIGADGLEKNPPSVFAAYSKDPALLKVSSSGGLFSELVKSFKGSYCGEVWGAALAEDCKVQHICIDATDDIQRLRGSKYQQSNMQGVYKRIKESLINEKYELFSGTPCQVAALYSFLKRFHLDDSKYLFTVEVVCHGVPSREVFIKYLTSLKEKNMKRPVSVNWRSKSGGWWPNRIAVSFEDGSILESTSQENPYQKGFLNNLYLRPSCYECNFARLPRVADIALADFWGYDGKLLKINENRGISLVCVSSEKGEKLFQSITDSLVYEQVTVEYAKKRSRHLWLSPEKNDTHYKIYENLDRLCFDEIDRRYINPKKSANKKGLTARAYRKLRRSARKLIR